MQSIDTIENRRSLIGGRGPSVLFAYTRPMRAAGNSSPCASVFAQRLKLNADPTAQAVNAVTSHSFDLVYLPNCRRCVRQC